MQSSDNLLNPELINIRRLFTTPLASAWLMHSVRRFEGARPRISIAFNFGV